MSFFGRFWKRGESTYLKVLEDGAKYPASMMLPTPEVTVTPQPQLTWEPGGISVLPAGWEVTSTTYSSNLKDLATRMHEQKWVIRDMAYRKKKRGSNNR